MKRGINFMSLREISDEDGGSAVCLRRFRRWNIFYASEKERIVSHYGRMLIFHVELIAQSFSTSEHLRTPVKYSSPFRRDEKSRDGCVSAIKEEPRPPSCSPDIDVVKFYEPYRDRFANRQDLLLLVRLASRNISTI